ncbi:MAG: hybrid sensor histidine kinase/response regulator [Desulfobulbaceae bacterium]
MINTSGENQQVQDTQQRLESREAFYRQTLADILAFSTRLTRNSELASLYQESNALARRILRLDYSTLMILSDDGQSLVIRDAIGFPTSMINSFSLLKGQGLSTYVATEKKAAMVEDFRTEKRFEVPPVIFQQGITSAVSVPMMLGDNVFGVMIGHTRSRRIFPPEEIDLYQSIANQSAVAIKNVMHLQSLEDSEKRFRTLIDRAGDAFFLVDMDGILVDVNKRACQSLGYTREELLGMSVTDLDSLAAVDCLQAGIAANQPSEQYVTINSQHQRKDGSRFPVEVRIGLLTLHDGNYLLGMARDITERQQAESERQQLRTKLSQAQKMEAIGTLAGGIAHDLNNILTPIFGHLELARLKMDPDFPAARHLAEVQRAAERAAYMVRQILTFGRLDSGDMIPVEVHLIVKEALKLLRATIPSTIEIRQRIDPHCGAVRANPTQIHQVLINLCTNAYHAMRENGGILSISLQPIVLSANDLSNTISLRPGAYLQLKVSDTGHGIDQAIQEKIFEPYFTTKGLDEGTGMGLAVVHGVVTRIGGHVTVHSEPGRGTTFHIYLPVLEENLSPREAAHEGPMPGGTERILIVDDEEMVLNVEQELLTSVGYQVTVATTPGEALTRFREHPDAFDLVVTDMTMPGMTGMELARKIMAIRPEIPVILCTGFSDLTNEEAAKLQGIREYVTKPLVAQTFSRTVRNILDQERMSSPRLHSEI